MRTADLGLLVATLVPAPNLRFFAGSLFLILCGRRVPI